MLGLKSEQNLGTLWRSAYQLGASGLFVVGERLLPREGPDVVRVSAEGRLSAWVFGYDDRPGHTSENVLHIPAGRPVD